MKKNTVITILIVVIIVLIIGGFVFAKVQNDKKLLASIQDKIIFFYGEGCPHCANVEKFFQENNIEDKIQFEKKEVYNDRGNAKLLILLAKRKCGFKENEIGVPFLWDGENSKCTVGDQPIIDYFKEKIVSKI